MKDELNIAIVGTGGMAASHALGFHAIEGVRIGACCDIDAERAEEFAARHSIPNVYTDYRALFEGESLDAVSVVSVDSTHAPISIAALKKETAEATVIIVAQRVNTVMDADRIIVLDDGEVAGMGTHKELIRSCEVYREIVSSQLSEEELA